MTRGGSLVRFSALCSLTGALLFAQHGGSYGKNSAGIGHSPIAPFHMPPSIGLSGPSIGLSGPSIGLSRPSIGSFGTAPASRLHGQYPSLSQPPYSAGHSAEGPWRRGSREARRAYGLPFAYIGAPYYLPFGNDFYPDAPADSQPPPSVDGSQLNELVQQLSAKIDDLQNQLGQRPAVSPAPAASETPQPPAPPLAIVLKNGQTLQVQSYAVMNNNFWDFPSQPARKIPLSNIDVAASIKASEANGAEFPPI